MKLAEQSCIKFTELTASALPAPGGGGVSALCGALAAALGDMVGELTVGKKKFQAVEEELREKMKRMQEIRVRFLELIDEDAENFLPLSKVYSLPKDTPGRDELMEQCLLQAMQAPLETFRLTCEMTDLLQTFAEKGSVLAISDAATAAALAIGTLMGAAVNVRVNSRLLKNRELARETEAFLEKELAVYQEKAEKVYRSVSERLNS